MSTHELDNRCWHDYYFWIGPHDQAQPDHCFWIDLFILDYILGDLLRQDAGTAPWIIHRRTKPDDKGHEFKLSCFALPEKAKALEDSIRSHPGFEAYLRFFASPVPPNPPFQRLKHESEHVPWRDFSGGRWPKEFNRPYSHYAYGFSRAYLELIAEVIDGLGQPRPDPNDPQSLATFYAQVRRKADDLWTSQGYEPFLHQVGAVFGYAWIEVRPRGLKGMQLIL